MSALGRVAQRLGQQGADDLLLDQVIERAALDGLHAEVFVGLADQHDDRLQAGLRLQAQESRQPEAVGQVQVEQDDVEAPLPQLRETRRRGVRATSSANGASRTSASSSRKRCSSSGFASISRTVAVAMRAGSIKPSVVRMLQRQRLESHGMTLLRVAEPQEERAHRLEREFQAVLDAAVDAVVLFDHEGRIELLNHAGERMFGYNEQEVIGLKVNILLPEPYRSQHDDYLRHYIEAGEPRIIGIGRELLAKRRDGSEFSAELAVGRVQGTDPPRFVGFIRDITVRRNAEEALRRSEAQLTIAQEIANLGNYVVHFDGKYEDYWSPHLYRVLGRRYGEPYIGVYEYLEPMVHPADRARWQQARDELDTSARSMDIEYRVIHPDGSLRYVHHIAQTTRAAGRPRAAAGRHAARHHRSAPRRGRSAADAGSHRALRSHLDDG